MAAKYKKQHDLLENDRQRIEGELAQMRKSATSGEERREGSPFGKREEEATETLELEKRLALENRLRQELVAIEHTLDKITQGTYGICDKCGKPIPPERLEALPQANLCIECKGLLAKNAKGSYPQR